MKPRKGNSGGKIKRCLPMAIWNLGNGGIVDAKPTI